MRVTPAQVAAQFRLYLSMWCNLKEGETRGVGLQPAPVTLPTLWIPSQEPQDPPHIATLAAKDELGKWRTPVRQRVNNVKWRDVSDGGRQEGQVYENQ